MPAPDGDAQVQPGGARVANIRGGTIPILDLALATGRRGLQDLTNSFAIITEYNTKVQGFLVRSVERIVNMNWEEIHPPPKGAGREHYLTAVTRVDKQLVEIIDVEKCSRRSHRRPRKCPTEWWTPRPRAAR